jgi:epoxyqueuosine reductase
LAVCPWNKFAKAGSETRLYAREELKMPDLTEFVTLDDKGFRDKFSGSPIKRIGRDRFIRNVLYAIGNSREQRFKEVVTPLVKDPDLAVSEAATWALTELVQNGNK